jgi:cephalosporin-C deacetylase
MQMARFDLPIEQLRTRRPNVADPSDFDEFWNRTLRESRAAGGEVQRVAHASDWSLVDIDDVVFPGFAGDPVRAWFVRPRGVTGPLPTIVEFVGYGRGRGLAHERLHWPVAGYAQLIVDSRGQGSTSGTGGQTADPHGSGPSTAGMLTRGIEDPETYYYRRVFTDAARAVDAVRSFPEVDESRVVVTGNSQGGYIAIAAAGLSTGLVAAMPTLPIMCDIPRVIGLTDAAPHSEIRTYLAVHRDDADRTFATLAYFDGVAFARRASAPALFAAAHMDTIAPPSGVYAAFTSWGHGGSEIVDYPWNGHEGGEGRHIEHQARWLRDLLRGEEEHA